MNVTFDEIVRQAYLENVDRGDMELLKVIEKVFYNGTGGGGGDSGDYSGIAFFDNSNTFAEVQAAIDDGKLPILKFYIMGAPAYFYCCEHSTVWVDFVSFGGLVKYQLRWDNLGNKQLSSQTLVTNQSPHFYGNPTAATQDVNDSSTKLATTSFVNRAINNAIADIAITGIGEPIKQALLQLARKVVYIDSNGQTYYDALYNALYPAIGLDSITATFTQGQNTIYDTDDLDVLRQYLVVTANYEDSTTETITDYTLSGTLSEGTSTITVSWGGKTDTFNVTVTAWVVSVSAVFTQGQNTIYTNDSLDILKQYLVVTAYYADNTSEVVTDYTISGTLTEGTSVITVTYGNKTTTFNVSVIWGYRLLESDFTRKKAASHEYPYYGTSNDAKRITYIRFDILLDGGKEYAVKATSTYSTAQMGLQFYNQKALDAVSTNSDFTTSDVYDPGWQSLTTTVTPPVSVNDSPIVGVRFTFRQSSSNPTISNAFSITELTIEEAEV